MRSSCRLTDVGPLVKNAFPRNDRAAAGGGSFAVMARRTTVIGRSEYIALPKLGVDRVEAKIDTGAFRSALHYQRIRRRSVRGEHHLVVTFQMGHRRPTVVFKRYQRVTVKSSTGQRTRRYLVTTSVRLNGHTVRTQFTLFDRSDMKFQVLLGRKFLAQRFLVDVSRRRLIG